MSTTAQTKAKTFLNPCSLIYFMVKIDKKKCIGCGTCVAVCPEIFEMTDDNKAKIKSKKNASCIKEAIEACPVEAISE